MPRIALAAMLALVLAVAPPASAHPRHRHHRRHHRAVMRADPRPRAWCGWWLRRNVPADPGKKFNLAIQWEKYGRPALGPEPGAIGVERHHVFKVIRVISARKVLAISGNDGHAVRVRVRSTRGVIAWRIQN